MKYEQEAVKCDSHKVITSYFTYYLVGQMNGW